MDSGKKIINKKDKTPVAPHTTDTSSSSSSLCFSLARAEYKQRLRPPHYIPPPAQGPFPSLVVRFFGRDCTSPVPTAVEMAALPFASPPPSMEAQTLSPPDPRSRT
ncbi:hypothetical protein VPH35_027389 [Triticum aestivum]